MVKVSHLAPRPAGAPSDAVSSQLETATEAIKALLRGLLPSEQERLLHEITEVIRPIPAPRAGEVLGAIVRLLPRKSEWTVGDIKHGVESDGVQARAKEIYNALGYLTRKGRVRRVGYGRYLVEGVELVTSDNLGLEPTRYDDE